jgi:hypothetical protein
MEEGRLQARQLFKYLHNTDIFDNKSQLIKFINMLDFKKKTKVMISFVEFSFALSGCGLTYMNKFQEFIDSQKKKKKIISSCHSRHKLPLYMSSVSSSMGAVGARRKESSDVNTKRITTRTPLVGGGVMYTCCPDIPTHSHSHSPVRRPSSSSTPVDVLPATNTDDSAINNSSNTLVKNSTIYHIPHKNFGKFIRQKTSKLNLLEVNSSDLLPPVTQCHSPVPPVPRLRGLLSEGKHGSPEAQA